MSTYAQRIEVKQKGVRLVNERFGGDFEAAFDHYDSNHDERIGRDELLEFLYDAHIGDGVGLGFLRGMWADGILEEVDTDLDGEISRKEFHAILGQ